MLIVGVNLLCMDSAHPDAVRIASPFVARQRTVIAWPARCGRRDMRRFADIYPTFLTKSGSDTTARGRATGACIRGACIRYGLRSRSFAPPPRPCSLVPPTPGQKEAGNVTN